jgi:hypothetical protein
VLNEYNPNIKEIDLSDGFIEIYDQGSLGSCAINAFCALFNYELVRALGMTQPNTSIAINNCLSMFMLSCIRNGTSTKYECNVVNKEKRETYKDIMPFRPSRYYLYYHTCNRNTINNINPNDFKDGGGTYIEKIIEKINSNGILEELPDENNNNWQLEKSLDDPLTTDEKEKKIEHLKGLKKPTTNKNDTQNIDALIEKYSNFSFNYTNIKLTDKQIKQAEKWKNIKKHNLKNITSMKENNLINIITIKENSAKISINDIRKYLQNSKPILIGMKFNLNNQILYQFNTIIPSAINEKEKGRHMMVIVGYDDDNHAFKIRNSWGAGWGKGGYCYLSYGFFDESSNINYDIELHVLNLDLTKYPKTV